MKHDDEGYWPGYGENYRMYHGSPGLEIEGRKHMAERLFPQQSRRADYIFGQHPRRTTREGVEFNDYLDTAQNVKIAELEDRIAYLEMIILGFTRRDADTHTVLADPMEPEPSTRTGHRQVEI